MSSAAIGEAYIGNASVGTLKIQDNAVTVPISYVNSASIVCGIAGGFTTVASLSINDFGIPYIIRANAYMNNNHATSTFVYAKVRLLFAGVVLFESSPMYYGFTTGGGSYRYPFGCDFVFTPSHSGALAFQIANIPFTGSYSASARMLSAIGSKR